MIDLEGALVDLGEQLDYPSGAGLVDAVRARITAAPERHDDHARRRVRVLLAVAAVVIVVAGAVVAIPPARHAVADWLGIGAVDVRRTEVLPSIPTDTSHTVPGAPGSTRSPAAPAVAAQLAEARRVVAFAIATPCDPSVGVPAGVDVDRRVPGGLVVLRYARFTLVEIATDPSGPSIRKFVDPATSVEPALVNGAPGLWIAGAHEISYIDRWNRPQTDTVRRSGPVLLWGSNGVTYRIEGFAHRADAERVANSVH